MAVELILDVDAVAPPLTGVGRYALELARRLPGSPGISSVRLTADGGWVRDLDARLASEPRSRMPANPQLQALLRPVHHLYRAAVDARRMRRYRRFPDAVYHATNYTLPVFPGPSVATVFDLSVIRYPEFHPPARVRVIRRSLEELRSRAHSLIAISEFTRGEIIDLLGFPPERVYTTALGVGREFTPRAPAQTRPTLSRLGLVHGGYTLCVASIEPRKNVEGLVAAYAKLPPKLRRRYPLVLAGDRGWKSAGVHDRIRRHTAEGWLRYVGYASAGELPHLMAGALGFMYPSIYEGFGLPVAEAMAAGVPVVTSLASSLPEVAAGAALLVDPADVAGLTEAIRRTIEDETWRAIAIERGRTVARRYTWDATVSRTIAAYTAVSRNRGSGTPPAAASVVEARSGVPVGPVPLPEP